MRSYLYGLVVALAALPLSAGSLRAQFGRNHPALVLDVVGHTAPVSQVLFTRNSKELITVSRDKTVRFWDVDTGEMVRVLRPPIGSGREGEWNAAALSPDGKILAVAGFGFLHGKDKTRSSPIFLIDVASGEIAKVLPGHSRTIEVLAFSGDGKRLASGGADRLVRIWDVAAGKEAQTLKGHAGPVTSLAFSPDSQRLVSAGSPKDPADVDASQAAWIWSVEKGAVLARLDKHHKGAVSQVAWSPDGNRIATGSSSGERFAVLWDGTGKFLKKLHYPNSYPLDCQSLAFTRDSNSLVFSALDAWRVNVCKLDLTGDKLVASYVAQNYFEAEDVPTGPAALSPDGRLVAVPGDRHHRVHLFNSRGNLLRLCGGILQQPSLVAWVGGKDTDSRTIAWRTTRLPKDYEHGNTLPAHFLDHAFQLSELRPVPVPEGKEVVFQRNRWGFPPQHLQLETGGKSLRLVRDKKPTDVVFHPRQGSIIYETVSFAGPEQLVFATSTGLLDVFDVSPKGLGKRLGFLAGFNGTINSIAPSPDRGRYLLGGGEDQVLHVWDSHRPGKEDPTKVHPGRLLSLFVAPPPPGKRRLTAEWIAWTPEGYYAASAGGERLMGWQVNNGPDHMGTFHPASRFRPQFYRPDVIKLLLKEGSLDAALKLADEARHQQTKKVEVADVLPPQVTVTVSPKAGAGQGGKVEITAEARNVGTAPVTALQLLIDDRPYAGPEGLKTLDTPRAGPVTSTWKVTLTPGPHEIRVLARTEASLGTSRGMVREGPPTPVTTPALYLVAVGIDAYPEPLALRGAVNDATLLEKTFKKHSSPLFRTIETNLITDQTTKVPTRQGILDGLSWLKQHMTHDDVGVFFFAGHGLQDKDGEYYLLPRDGDPNRLKATALSRPELKPQMQALPGRIVVLLDACNSGAIGLLFDDLSRELIDEDCGVVVMCASRPRQPAQEKDGHGFFTRSLIGGLSGKGPSSKRDGCVYLHHLQQYVIDTVLELSHDQQHPVAVAPPWMRPFGLSKP